MTSAANGHQQREYRPSVLRASGNRWWLFCLAIVLVKLLLLGCDPWPRLYPGDSVAYLRAAVTGPMPEDLPYFYGYLVGWLCNGAASLGSLVLAQALISVVIAIAVAWICRAMFSLVEWLSYLFGFLCSIDPLQLVWERYVMPETLGLFFYTLVLQQSFVYLRNRRAATLVFVQVLAVITVAFRSMLLVPLVVMAAALPVIAFGWQRRPPRVEHGESSARFQFLHQWQFWAHIALGLLSISVLTWGYGESAPVLANRGRASLNAMGYNMLSAWAPAIWPQDSPDPRLAEILEHGSEFEITSATSRHAQRFARGRLIDRWRQAEADSRKSRDIAFRTAMNALRRDPAAVIGLAARTYYAFWQGRAMERLAKVDLGGGTINDSRQKSLLDRYHWRAPVDVRAEPLTLSRWYYLAATPYYFAILLSPLLPLTLLFAAAQKPYAIILFAHTWLVFCTTFLLSLAPTLRYLQPLSVLMSLSAALALKYLYPIFAEDSRNSQPEGAAIG
jgi:hypothetical protein